MNEERLHRIEVPEDYEVFDAEALARFLGYKKQTVQAYLARGNWKKIPKPNRQLGFGPVWYYGYVRDWRKLHHNLHQDTPQDA